MKTYAIADEALKEEPVLGYLFYYEKSRQFLIELSDQVEPSQFPLFFSSFVERGIYSVDPLWSARWVRLRIVPQDRQNLGTVLRDNSLKEYDPMKLLLLGHGRCAQDDLSIRPAIMPVLPRWLQERMLRRLSFAAPLPGFSVFAGFEDGSVVRTDLRKIFRSDRKYDGILRYPEHFGTFHLAAGGAGIVWQDDLFISAGNIAGSGELLPVQAEEIRILCRDRILDTSQVCHILGCSRQYVDRMVKSGELPAIQTSNTRLYVHSDVERLLW